MIIAGVLLPCVPTVINAAFGYGIMTFSPMVCLVAVQDVGFCTDGLTEGIELAILGTLQALIFMKLMKVGITTVVRPNIAGFQLYFVCLRGFPVCLFCFCFVLFVCFCCCLLVFFQFFFVVFLFVCLLVCLHTFHYIYIACCKEAPEEGK